MLVAKILEKLQLLAFKFVDVKFVITPLSLVRFVAIIFFKIPFVASTLLNLPAAAVILVVKILVAVRFDVTIFEKTQPEPLRLVNFKFVEVMLTANKLEELKVSE